MFDLENELHSEHSEQMTLGALLKSPDVMHEVSEILTDDDFYYPAHKKLYATMMELYGMNKFDPPTLKEWLLGNGMIGEVGGADYLNNLRLSVPTMGLVKFHADKVKEHAVKRHALKMVYEIQRMTMEEEFGSIDEYVSAVHSKLNNIEASKSSNMVSLKEMLHQHIQNKINGEKKKSPMLGIPVIDEWMNGIGRDRLIVLAGRPGGGKTALSLKIARNGGMQGFGPSLFFSLEMGHEELADRLISDVTAVPFGNILRSELSDSQKVLLPQAEELLSGSDLHFDDKPAMSMPYIASQCRKMKRKHGSLSVIVIDYLGLIDRMQKRGENDTSAIGRITSECKRLAREMGCSVMLLAQMNRDIEKRATKRPILSDLRESGNIEQDADMVIFLSKDEEKSDVHKSHVDFIVAKGRQTGVRDFELEFYGTYQRIIGKRA